MTAPDPAALLAAMAVVAQELRQSASRRTAAANEMTHGAGHRERLVARIDQHIALALTRIVSAARKDAAP